MPGEIFVMPPRECGRIQQKRRNRRMITFMWSIPNFLAWRKAGRVLKSPAVEWLGDSWHLQIYPCGEKRARSSLACAWVGLSLLCSPGHPRESTPVRFTFGIKRVDKTEAEILQDHSFANRSHSWYNPHFLKRRELVKLRNQLISSDALTVTCILHIDDRDRARNPWSYLGTIGYVQETFRRSDGVGLEWTIPPKLLSNVAIDYYKSPDFSFLNNVWNLQIYASGDPGEVSELINFEVCKSYLNNCQEPVHVTVGTKTGRNSTEKIWYQNALLAKHESLMTFPNILSVSELPKPKLIMDPSNALIITCTLRTGTITRERKLSEDRYTFGDIHEKFRSDNEIHLEWRIPQFSSLSEELTRFSSPVLEFLNTSWQLRIYPDKCPRWVGLQLRKLEWSISQETVFLTFGIKRVDSTEEVIYPSERLLELKYKRSAYKFLSRSELSRRKYHIVPSDVLTITCTISTKAATFVTGENQETTLRVRECSNHKEVEWDVPLSEKISPTFMIGSECYKLVLKSYMWAKDCMEVILYSVKPSTSLSQSAFWWAGLKRPDGAYLFSNSSGVLNLENNHGTINRSLLTFGKTDVRRELPELEYPRLILTIFLRMSVDRTTGSEEMCSHGTAEMFGTKSHGSIQEIDCAFHKQVEWDVVFPKADRTFLENPVWTKLSSHEFTVETVKLKFECVFGLLRTRFTVNLYSQCPNAGPFPSGRFWVALKSSDGTYSIKNLRGELGLKEECELWTLRGSLKFRYYEFESIEVTRRFTVVFRYSREETPAFTACNHGIITMPLQAGGSIREEEFTSHKRIEWSMCNNVLRLEPFVSPEFVIGSQRYVMEFRLENSDTGWMKLYLHRFGSSVTDTARFVRWRAGLKRGNATYKYLRRDYRRGKLDLKEECEIWTNVHYLLRVSYNDLEAEFGSPDFRLTIFFELREDRLLFFENASSCVEDMPLPVSMRRRSEEHSEIVFLVKGVEFKVLRDKLINGGPVLNVMFDHGTVEKKTGIVTIEDCEPAIFEEFLHYITSGFLRELTEHNAVGLYMVADKYILYDLKQKSLQAIQNTISVHNFSDVFTLALIYEEGDLMSYAIDFFTKNVKDIMQTYHWRKFYKDNRAVVNKLRIELSRYPLHELARRLFGFFAKIRNKRS